jgi:UDP-glucuronate decarboxylase
MNSVLIAGGAGFLGSHLCDYYIARGYEVTAIDNLSTGSMNNIEHLRDKPEFRFIQADVSEQLPAEITGKTYDSVLNMASPASPPHYQRLGLETLKVGSLGTFNLLELARKNNAKFFHASTSEVYGDPEVHPQPETYKGSVNCYGPRSMYDEAKRYAEALIYTYREKYGIPTFIGRFFNTYGPRMDSDDGRVVSNFIVQALRGNDITIYGNGSQTRSFCYVDDLVDAITKLLDSDYHEPINLGNPGEFTIRELAEMVIEKTHTSSKCTFKALPVDDPTQRKPVIDVAKKELGWSPNVPLQEGLQRTIAYFEAQEKKITT